MTPTPRRAGRMWVTPKAARLLEGDTASTEDEKLLERPEPEFLDTDPWRALRILGEFVEGFDAMARVGPAVTVFGSARTRPDDPLYETARDIGRRLADAGYAVITGGGPGIMEAANRGCREGGGLSVGCNIELPHEQGINAVRRSRRRVPLLLRAQDHVREVRRRLRHPARRLRDARRAVRGADADPDGQGPPLPGRSSSARAYWAGLLDWMRDTLLASGDHRRETTCRCST